RDAGLRSPRLPVHGLSCHWHAHRSSGAGHTAGLPPVREGVPSMKTVRTDVAIIGAGTAGLTARKAALKAGASVVLIEDGPYGTTCARVGCMPSKLLIAAAEASHGVKHASAFGVHAENVRIDGREVMSRVRRERDRFVGFVLSDVERIPD